MNDIETISATAGPLPPQPVWRKTASLATVPGWSDAFAVTPVMAHLEAAARVHPRAPALIGLRERLDLDTVVRRAHRIGAWIEDTVPPDQPVTTLLANTPSGIVAILGCLAAGRITIPLNPAEPPDRLAVLLNDAAAPVLLTDQPSPPALPPRMRVLRLADCAGAPAARAAVAGHDPDAPCMVHYTSGSSGRPKGVVVSTYNILFRALQNIDGLRLDRASRVVTAFGPESGAGIAMIVACLIRGGAVLVASLLADGLGGVLRLCASARADVLVVPSPVLGNLLALDSAAVALASLRIVRLGAAAVAHTDVLRWRARLPPGCGITHSYGSTEAMISAELTVLPDRADGEPNVPIGRMRPGLEYALLGEDGRAVPDGASGELVVRGRYVAIGEWQAGRIVAGRMQPDPTRPGARIFRTGDLLRFDADGMLRFVGRVDRQLKINGVRVEPAEIEAVIRADAAVHDAAVVPSGAGGLHAFVAAPDADPDTLRQAFVARMRDALPPALRPRRFSIIAHLPTLPGGKVDMVTLRRWAEQAEDRP